MLATYNHTTVQQLLFTTKGAPEKLYRKSHEAVGYYHMGLGETAFNTCDLLCCQGFHMLRNAFINEYLSKEYMGSKGTQEFG